MSPPQNIICFFYIFTTQAHLSLIAKDLQRLLDLSICEIKAPRGHAFKWVSNAPDWKANYVNRCQISGRRVIEDYPTKYDSVFFKYFPNSN